MSEIRISELFGQFCVEGLDSNGVWVSTEPGQDNFGTLGEAQDYVDGWLENNSEMVQVAGIAKP